MIDIMDNGKHPEAARSTALVNSLVYGGVFSDSSKVNLFQKRPPQEFKRDDVFVCQSLDPYQRVLDAHKILSSGGSVFLSNNHREMRK